MFLERQLVSRKTPGDGKLEISARAAERIRAVGSTLEVELGELRGAGRVETMPCTCQKVGRSHEHHFVASELLKTLRPATQVDVHLDESAGQPGERARVTVLPVE
jgi:hypothetical protein